MIETLQNAELTPAKRTEFSQRVGSPLKEGINKIPWLSLPVTTSLMAFSTLMMESAAGGWLELVQNREWGDTFGITQEWLATAADRHIVSWNQELSTHGKSLKNWYDRTKNQYYFEKETGAQYHALNPSRYIGNKSHCIPVLVRMRPYLSPGARMLLSSDLWEMGLT